MSKKTTRAFRTIGEAAEELDLQPHVLRFWESKFPDIKPMKRAGGRRFYRPEDIKFLRGIKVLLHDENHPIKDVQKLIRIKGPGRVIELGQSTQKAAQEKTLKETVFIPERLQNAPETLAAAKPSTPEFQSDNKPLNIRPVYEVSAKSQAIAKPAKTEPPPLVSRLGPVASLVVPRPEETAIITEAEQAELEAALSRLTNLCNRWQTFKASA